MNLNEKILVIGASENIERYSNKAIHLFKKKQFNHIFAFGLKKGNVASIEIDTEWNYAPKSIDTISLYVGAANQAFYIDKILSLQPKRVIFNPGTENQDFEAQLIAQNTIAEEACTLVLLNLGIF